MFDYLFGTVGFMPHGMCLLWRPDIVAMHVGADVLIFLAYSSIAICLHRFVRARPEFRYSRIAIISAAFIGGCGITHAFAAVSLWWPAYGAQAVLKVLVALISVVAAVSFWRGLPSLMDYPSMDEISARRRAEELLRAQETELRNALRKAHEAERTKAAFLAAMSHDLRTPLNCILGFAEALVSNIFGAMRNAKQSEYAKDIYDSALHLRVLIDDLLELSGIEAERKILAQRAIPVREVVGEIVRHFEMSAAFTQRAVKVRVRSEVDEVFSENEVLRRMLHNLLSNSAKYAPDSGVIDIEVESVRDGVEIRVIDDGPGFPSGREENMRAPFSRERASDDGLGIGLAIVDTLIRQHGGEMRLNNVPGRGAQVTLVFPNDPRSDNRPETVESRPHPRIGGALAML